MSHASQLPHPMLLRQMSVIEKATVPPIDNSVDPSESIASTQPQKSKDMEEDMEEEEEINYDIETPFETQTCQVSRNRRECHAFEYNLTLTRKDGKISRNFSNLTHLSIFSR